MISAYASRGVEYPTRVTAPGCALKLGVAAGEAGASVPGASVGTGVAGAEEPDAGVAGPAVAAPLHATTTANTPASAAARKSGFDWLGRVTGSPCHVCRSKR